MHGSEFFLGIAKEGQEPRGIFETELDAVLLQGIEKSNRIVVLLRIHTTESLPESTGKVKNLLSSLIGYGAVRE